MLAFYSLPLALFAVIASTAPSPVGDTPTLHVGHDLLWKRANHTAAVVFSAKELYLPDDGHLRVATSADKAQAAECGTVCPKWYGYTLYVQFKHATCPSSCKGRKCAIPILPLQKATKVPTKW